jgi:membrane-bound lytic murein transglycosylase MltF
MLCKEKPQASTFRKVLNELYYRRKNDPAYWRGDSQYVCAIINDLHYNNSRISYNQMYACHRYIEKMLGRRGSLENWVCSRYKELGYGHRRAAEEAVYLKANGTEKINNTRIAWVKHIISVLEDRS